MVNCFVDIFIYEAASVWLQLRLLPDHLKPQREVRYILVSMKLYTFERYIQWESLYHDARNHPFPPKPLNQ